MPKPLGSAAGAFPSSSDTSTSIRCSKCDFAVLRFTDQKWAADADYMFFRNYMPNVDKLKAKLQDSDGQCALACQCSWVTVELGAPHGVGHWFQRRS